MKELLIELRNKAQAKIDSGQEPPWARDQYLKLIDNIDAIIRGMNSTIDLEDLQQLEQLPANVLPLEEYRYLSNNARYRHADEEVQLPM